MSYRPKYLGHVNIYVRNAERSHQWYEDVLGLHTYDYMPGRAAFMSADQEQSHEVALIQVGEVGTEQIRHGTILSHYRFKVLHRGARCNHHGVTSSWSGPPRCDIVVVP